MEFGDEVTVVTTLVSGEEVIEQMPAFEAIMVALWDDRNGDDEIFSCKIVWGETNARQWDMSL